MDSLFGAEGSLIVRFVVAFVIVLALIGLTFWIVRRFGGTRVGQAAKSGRQPRLAVIDAAPVDGRRRLVLVRRDNVEHLLMIGGPSDLVVEQNILRAVPVNAPRDMPVPRAEGARESSRVQQPLDDDASWPAPQPEPREREPRPAFARPEPLARSPRPSFPEPTVRAPLPAGISPLPPRAYEPAPPSIAPAAEPAAEPAGDAALANMAQRLEAALRRPGERPASQNGNTTPDLAPSDPPPTAPDSPASPRPGAAKDAKGRTVLDSLEEEMASLLGRPPEKT